MVSVFNVYVLEINSIYEEDKMRLYKCMPTWSDGFDAEEFEANTKEELLNSDLCKSWIKQGYTIAVSPSGVQEIEGGKIMAFKRISQKRGDVRFYVVATYKTYDDEVTLCKWLPIFEHILFPKKLCDDTLIQERRKWIDEAFDYHNNRIQASYDGPIHISDAEIERTRKLAPLYKRLAEIYEGHERHNLEFRRTLPPEAFQGYGGQTPQYDGPTELPWSELELTEIRELEEKINGFMSTKSE